MALTGRVPLLLLAGVPLVLLAPRAATVSVWTALVVAVTLLDLALAPRPQDVEIEREPARLAPVRLGEPTTTTLRLRSRRRARCLVRDAWQPTAGATGERHRRVLTSDADVRVATDLHPSRRGDLEAAGVTLRISGPLGLAGRQRTRAVPGVVRVLPAFPSRRALPSRLARLHELEGRTAVLQRGAGTEFDSLRDYARGDDVRAVDWRATARARRPVVRTWRPERDRRIVLVVDSGRTSAARVGEAPRLDAALDAALFLAALAARAGDRVDLVVGDRTVRARARSGRERDGGVRRFDDALAGVEPVLAEADWSVLAGAVGELGRHRALVVLLTALDAAPLEEGLLPLLSALVARHRVVVATTREPELRTLAATRTTLAAAYAAAAAEQELAERRRTTRLLATLGVEVVDAEPGDLAVDLGDRYLALKAAGLL